jgi:hypothetical protein
LVPESRISESQANSSKNKNTNQAVIAQTKKQKMKNQFTLINAMPRSGQFGLALAGLVLLAIATSSPAGPKPAPEVLPPSSLPYGYSYEEWSAKWWQWTLGQSTNHMESLGNPDICSGPASRVRFPGPSRLGGTGSIHFETNHVIIDAGTPLFFPILDLWQDNGNCPLSAFTTFTAVQLAAMDEQSWAGVTETSCTIDGISIDGMEDPTNSDYHVITPPFTYTTAEKDNVLAGDFGATCIPGDYSIYPAVGDGIYLMLAPLAPGKHTIHTIGIVGPTNAPDVEADKLFEITVLPLE